MLLEINASMEILENLTINDKHWINETRLSLRRSKGNRNTKDFRENPNYNKSKYGIMWNMKKPGPEHMIFMLFSIVVWVFELLNLETLT